MVTILTDIRNWIRVAAFPNVKRMLEDALPDSKSRHAYQMCDGKNSRDAICKTVKLGTATFHALQERCAALGLISEIGGKKRRLFDLRQFGLLSDTTIEES